MGLSRVRQGGDQQCFKRITDSAVVIERQGDMLNNSQGKPRCLRVDTFASGSEAHRQSPLFSRNFNDNFQYSKRDYHMHSVSTFQGSSAYISRWAESPTYNNTGKTSLCHLKFQSLSVQWKRWNAIIKDAIRGCWNLWPSKIKAFYCIKTV